MYSEELIDVIIDEAVTMAVFTWGPVTRVSMEKVGAT